MKTVYLEVFQEILHFPEITTRKGKWLWFSLGPIYWAVAFVVSAGVPNLNGVSQVVGSLLILNFTYTFPAFLYLGYQIQIDAIQFGEGFDPNTGLTTRFDQGFKRYWRAFKVNWPINVCNIIYGTGGLCLSALGAYAAVVGLIEVFGPGGTAASSFGCAVPL